MAQRRAPTIGRTHDPQVVALYQRGMREYDRRTSAGATEAIRSFSSAVARDSTYARGWVGLAKAYVRVYERGFYVLGVAPDSALKLAVIAADRALTADSADAQSWVAVAMARRDIDPTDVAPAIRAARRAIALDSTDGPAWHYLAVSLAESGNMNAALATWRECVRRAPRYTQGLSFLALGHWWHKQFDSAKVWGDSVVSVDPSYLLGRTTLGGILSDLGDQPRAIAAFEAARRLSTDIEIPNALAGRAVAEARAGHRAEARATVRQADSLASRYSPTPLHTAIYLGQAYAQLGDVERALSWLTRYPTRQDLHFQMHLRCEPPLRCWKKSHAIGRYFSRGHESARADGEPIASDSWFRASLTSLGPHWHSLRNHRATSPASRSALKGSGSRDTGAWRASEISARSSAIRTARTSDSADTTLAADQSAIRTCGESCVATSSASVTDAASITRTR
jgi:tetratricopeptide (TPR) repeat protein